MKTGSIVASLSRKAGGLFESVRGLHLALAELPETSVTVFGLEDEFTTADLPAWKPLVVQAFPVVGWRQFGYAPSLKRELLGKDFEILHTHGIWTYTSVVANAWHRSKRRPYLISPQGMLDPWAVRNSAWKKRLALAFYERRNLEGAACIRALCESEAQSIRAFGLENPICIIPNGIDLPVEGNAETLKTEMLKSRQEADGGASAFQHFSFSDFARQGRKVLLYLGRIHPKKGLVNLIKAWKLALNHQPSTINSWVLAIAGWDQGGHEAELKRLATELGVKWADARGNAEILQIEKLKGEMAHFSMSACQHVSVLFVGPQFDEDKARCYRNCEAFILPSLSEGMPVAVLEAWAYGKPVLMTPECNLPEGFAAGAAIRIELNSEKLKSETRKAEGSIAAGLRELFAMSGESRQAMGARGRALVADKFAWPKIARDMRAVYEWVLGGGTKPDCVE